MFENLNRLDLWAKAVHGSGRDAAIATREYIQRFCIGYAGRTGYYGADLIEHVLHAIKDDGTVSGPKDLVYVETFRMLLAWE